MTESERRKANRLKGLNVCKRWEYVREILANYQEEYDAKIAEVEDNIQVTSVMGSEGHTSDISKPTERYALDWEKRKKSIQQYYDDLLGQLTEEEQNIDTLIAVANLTKLQFRIIKLRHFNDCFLRVEDIAKILNWSEKTINTHLTEAYIKIGELGY